MFDILPTKQERADYHEAFQDRIEDWDYLHTFYWNDWEDEPDPEALLAANRLYSFNNAAAFENYRSLAERGSKLAHIHMAQSKEYGLGTEQDLDVAADHLIKGIEMGSWSASLHYSHMLARHKHWDDCIRILEEMVAAEIYPGYFWLAWRLHKRGASKAEHQRIDTLLTKAHDEGHPGALVYRAKFRSSGKMGFAKIPSGIIDVGRHLRSVMNGVDEE